MDYDKLEQYLFDLEKNLQDFSPSERAKIITENHDHILQAKEKYPEKTLTQILDDLGPAQKVANHYRLDSGRKTFKPKKHPVIKWLSIAFLGSFGLFFVFLLIVIWKFTPIFEVDEKNQRVVILGGLIDVNGISGKVKLMDKYHFVENKFTNQFDGAMDMAPDQDEIIANFKSGIFNFKLTPTRKVTWSCKLESPPSQDIINLLPHALEINLEAYGGGSCDIEIPADMKLTVDGDEGQVSITEPEFDTFVELTNGTIIFTPSPEIDYNYEIKVSSGTAEDFQSSTKPNAYEVKLYLENGTITK